MPGKARTPTKEEKLFLKIALKNGLLERRQVQEILEGLSDGEADAIAFIRERGWLDGKRIRQVEEAITARRVARIDQIYARILRDRGLVDTETLRKALSVQRKKRYTVRLGEMLVNARLIAMSDHADALRELLERLEDHRRRPQERKTRRRKVETTKTRPAPLPGLDELSRGPTDSRPVLSRRPPESSSRRMERPKTTVRARPVLELKGDAIPDIPAARPETATDAPADEVEVEPVKARDTMMVDALDDENSVGPISDSAIEVYRPKEEDKLLRSAIEIEIDDEDEDSAEEATRRARDMVADDVKVAESLSRSGVGNFSEDDREELSRASGALLEEKLRSTRLARMRVVTLASGGLLVLVVLSLIFEIVSNRSAYKALRSRLSEATRVRDEPGRLSNLMEGIGRDFSDLGRTGLDDAELLRFYREVRALSLEARFGLLLSEGRLKEAESRLEQQRRESVAALREGRLDDASLVPAPLLDRLSRELDAERLLRAGDRAHTDGRFAVALRSWSRALALEPARPERLQTRVDKLVGALTSRLDKGLERLDSMGVKDGMSLKDIDALAATLKLITEARGPRPEARAAIDQVRQKRHLLSARRLLSDRDYSGALAKALTADAIRSSIESRAMVEALRNNLRAAGLYRSGLAEERAKAMIPAANRYREALRYSQDPRQVKEIAVALRRCEPGT